MLDNPLDGLYPQHSRTSLATKENVIYSHISYRLFSSVGDCHPDAQLKEKNTLGHYLAQSLPFIVKVKFWESVAGPASPPESSSVRTWTPVFRARQECPYLSVMESQSFNVRLQSEQWKYGAFVNVAHLTSIFLLHKSLWQFPRDELFVFVWCVLPSSWT